MHRDVPAADRMLVRLSDLLRMTLDSAARPEIRLTEEMEFLAKYLQIEQVRLGDRLTVEFDVDDDVLDAMVPVLDSAATGRERDQARHRAGQPAGTQCDLGAAATATCW